MRTLALCCLLALICLLPVSATQNDQPIPVKPATKPEQKPAEVRLPVIYRPPLRGAPKSRVAGGTRAPVETHADVQVLGPEHTGRAATDQPVLYWYLSEGVDLPIELTLIDDHGIPPIARVRLEGPTPAGIHAWSLAGEGVRLVSGGGYQWSVAIVPDPERRSRDVFSSARFRYVPLPGEQTVASLADQGYWYDAFAESVWRFQGEGGSRTGSPVAALLSQVGLEDVPPRLVSGKIGAD